MPYRLGLDVGQYNVMPFQPVPPPGLQGVSLSRLLIPWLLVCGNGFARCTTIIDPSGSDLLPTAEMNNDRRSCLGLFGGGLQHSGQFMVLCRFKNGRTV